VHKLSEVLDVKFFIMYASYFGKVAVSWLKIVRLGLAILSHETATLPVFLLNYQEK